MSNRQHASHAPGVLAAPADPLGIRGIDHIELWVGNARLVADWLTRFGLRPLAYAGPETGVGSQVSYALAQGDARVVVTSSISPQTAGIAAAVTHHGDHVHGVAFEVDDADVAFQRATRAGARPCAAPGALRDDRGTLRTAAIGGVGDVAHTFVGRDDYHGVWWPGYRPIDPNARPATERLAGIDSVHAVVWQESVSGYARLYAEVLGFRPVTALPTALPAPGIVTQARAVLTRPVVTGGPQLKLTLAWPATGRPGPADQFLHRHGDAGVALVLFGTDDILAAVRGLRDRGVRFRPAPRSTSQGTTTDRALESSAAAFARQGIRVEHDDDGRRALRVLTEPLGDRPTLAFGLIERLGPAVETDLRERALA